jgi:hypothetical protein
MLGICIGYQQVENYVLQPTIQAARRTSRASS